MDRKVAVQVQFDKDCSDVLKAAAKAGFESVSIGFGSYEGFAADGWEKKIRQLKEELSNLGLTCVMTHSPYYDLRISADVRYPAVDISMERCLEATAMLGAGIMAMHPRGYYPSGTHDSGDRRSYNLRGLMPDDPKGCFSLGIEDIELSFRYNLEYWKPLAERAVRLGCLIGVENLPVFPGWSMTFFSSDPDAQIMLIDGLGEGGCGVWDFGHAYLTDKGGTEPLKKVGNRIKGLHVHDNDLSSDQHLIPFLGSIDWHGQIDALKSTGFDGYITLELAYRCDDRIGKFMEDAYRAACRLNDMLRV